MSKVIIAKEPGAIDVIFDRLNLREVLAQKNKIFIKVNLRAAAVKNYNPCAITNLSVIEALTKKLADLGKNVVIAEGTSSRLITERAIENSGVKKLIRSGVQVINLNAVRTERIYLPQADLKYMDVYRPVLQADFIISLPVMKTHVMTLVTLSMKNMMGVVDELTLPRFHLKGLEQSIFELNGAIRPDLAIVDATRSMEGFGPVRGSEVKLDTLVAGFDAAAVDGVCCQMMGFEPKEVKHLGYFENPEIIGELVVRKFKRPNCGPIDFYYYSWFNWLMSKRIFHKIIYEYAYFTLKKLFNLIG